VPRGAYQQGGDRYRDEGKADERRDRQEYGRTTPADDSGSSPAGIERRRGLVGARRLPG
jgi:hypothetical protein